MIGGPMREALQSETSRPQRVSATLRRFARAFRPHAPLLALVLALMVAGTWAQVRAPARIGQVVDCYLAPAAPGEGCHDPAVFPGLSHAARQAGLARAILEIAGLYVLSALTGGLMFYGMTQAGQHVLRQLRVDVFQHILRLSVGYHTRHEAGDTMSRITNDADTIQQVLSFALVQVLSGGLLLVWIAVSMLRLSVGYALVAMAVLPLMLLATSYFSRRARRAFRVTRREMGSVNADLQEGIAGVREAQAFHREQANIQAFRQVNAANRDANIQAVSFTAALAPTLEALGYLAIMLVTVVGGLALLGGRDLLGTPVSLGLMVTFISYVQRFNQPVQQISVLWANLQSALAGGERIFGLLDVEPEVRDRPDARPLPRIRGEVVFEQVEAAYTPGQPVLKGVSLHAAPGEMIAIVGPTGAGKTTLAGLIARFYDVTAGRVRIDGHDVRDVTTASLRAQIGMVLQDSFLFSDTILENIRFGRPSAGDEEVIAAARVAHADQFIERLPDGYATLLGERGAGLSQGQRQLLAIARAALADPRLLILDEATSSVDTRTERLIQAALERLLAGRTSFVIAHRLSTIRHADQVLMMQDGRIVEAGTHAELLAQGGAYAALYASQFARQQDAGLAAGG